MMETSPDIRARPQRTATPKMSGRKKSLFTNGKQSPIKEEFDNVVIDGIRPFSPDANKIILEECPPRATRKKSKKKLNVGQLRKGEYPNIQKTFTIPPSPDADIKRTSPRTARDKNVSTNMDTSLNVGNSGKENFPVTPKKNSADELFTLFDNSLNLKNVKKTICLKAKEDLLTSNISSINFPDQSVQQRKRNTNEICAGSPQCKISKPVFPKIKFISKESSISGIHIPTKCFYSGGAAKKTSLHFPLPKKSLNIIKDAKPKKHTKFTKANSNINKGVRHNVKRQRKSLNQGTIEDILKTINREKFKFLPSERIFKKQVVEIHDVLKTCGNSIEMARPMRIRTEEEESLNHFSDSIDETSSESDITEISTVAIEEASNKLSNTNVKKKFFKSGGHGIKNQFQITNKIKATITNGKLLILPTNTRKTRHSKSKVLDATFSSEQAKVNEIIEKLELTQDISVSELSAQNDELNVNIVETKHTIPQPLVDDEMFANFRERLPYDTNDPEKIEQQHLLLDFLITNQICTEKNFNIFIADPANNKEEAARIVDNLVAIVSDKDEMDNHLREVQAGPDLVEEQTFFYDICTSNEASTEENITSLVLDREKYRKEADKLLNTYIENDEIETAEMIAIEPQNFSEMESESINICENLDISNAETCSSFFGNLDLHCAREKNSSCKAESGPKADKNEAKLFSIFHSENYKPIQQRSVRKKQPNFLNRGKGSNQYQIDAGQKQFGAKQCNQCGLVYTVHEPEEERIHNEYHNSLHILKFKGWIDEDIVAEYPEWGPDGRIIRVSNFSHSKRCERVKEVLKVVDKELGFTSYFLPEIYVAFLAIRKNQIIGFCLVQPIKEAHRFICMDGVDCCTNEKFTSKCGISRIWVSPFHRRMRIGTKLIKAVQFNTLLGDVIIMDEIAFSAPTHDGKVFAQMVSNRKDFLVYQ